MNKQIWIIILLSAAVAMFASVILLLEPAEQRVRPVPLPVQVPEEPAPPSVNDVIRISAPQRNEVISNPLQISGEARGMYFFEASFPIRLLDGDGQEIAAGVAAAEGNWMTEDFVPFTATLTFVRPATANGSLVFVRDNPSGLPENDLSFVLPISFGEALTPPVALTTSTSVSDECQPSGCSGEICSDENMVSTCMYKPEFQCYKKATCGRNKTTGKCEWTQTAELKKCLEKEKTASPTLEVSF